MSDYFDFKECLVYCQGFAKRQMKPFAFEEAKWSWIKDGNPLPNHFNVWGKIASQMASNGLIFIHGFQRSKSINAKGTIVRTWMSKEYRLKQQNNAKSYKGETLF